MKDLRCLIGLHSLAWGMTSEGYHEWCERHCGFRVDGWYERKEAIPRLTLIAEELGHFARAMVELWKL